MHDIIQGNCLEVLTQLEDNSIDAIVTDPPYELGFMGKSWDNTGIANNPLMWAECLRVLKPGGHLLAFSGTRTYHRMAVAIEDAGFEVRDMIEWIYSTGFPKSLNIGKAVDKLQGNEREIVGEQKLMGTARRMKGGNFNDFGGEDTADVVSLTKGTSEWEGWGTALKPAHEPICMARKPLGNSELDIAKNICYNITEKGLITNSKIIWRIKNVKSAEKQKMSNYSTPTQLQKTVVVSAEFVETKENESVGKKIQKLIDSICESGIQETGNKPEKQVLKAISKTRTEYQDTGENINTNEKQKPLKHTEENASVVENQDLSSLPLTTLEAEEDSTEKKSKTETSMSSLKSTDTQKTDIDCSVATATSQWVCMDIVRTLKVSFEGKEYDFIELTDGSLVWNENLEPYRKQQKLNVAENCLKYGTGGINIDESRVESENGRPTGLKKDGTRSQNKAVYGDFNPDTIIGSQETNLGRFPANLIHDNSEEVRECFPETKSGGTRGDGVNNSELSWKNTSKNIIANNHIEASSGNASRFFKSIVYVPKASKSERNKGLDSTLTVKYNGSICKNKKEENMVAVQLLQKVISEQELVSFSTEESGENIMVQCQSDSLSTILTETKRIIELKIYNSLTLSLTNESTQVANSEMEVGGNLAESVEDLKRWLLTTTKGNQELALGASRVVLETLQLISKKENWKNLGNFHSTVKPIALMEYLIKMVTPKGGIVLDPFAGSGSTLVAAKQNGFQYVGIELDKDYCIIAESRLKQKTLKQEVLF